MLSARRLGPEAWASRQTLSVAGTVYVGGEKGRGEAEWASAPKLGSGELQLEQRSSCNPLGAVSSWLNKSRSHRKRPQQEGREEGSGAGGGGQEPKTPGLWSAGTKKGSETESALTGLVPVELQPPEQGDASRVFSADVARAGPVPILHSAVRRPR